MSENSESRGIKYIWLTPGNSAVKGIVKLFFNFRLLDKQTDSLFLASLASCQPAQGSRQR